MGLVIHPGAAKDAREIAAKYAGISVNLVDRFWNELDTAIDGIGARRSLDGLEQDAPATAERVAEETREFAGEVKF